MTVSQTLASSQVRRMNPMWIVLYVILAIWVLSRALLTSPSERLRDLPADAVPIAGRDGMLLLAGPGVSEGVHGIPENRGSKRQLVPPPAASGAILSTWLTPTGVVFQTGEPASPAVGSGDSRLNRGPGTSRSHVRLWTASLDGSPARELLAELRMEAAVTSGDTCFWLRSPTPTTPNGPARSRSVMTTPLSGGRSREIWSGRADTAFLEPLGGGVTWSVLRGDAFRLDRYVALPPRFDVELIPDCSGPLDVLNGRLYWLHFVPKPFFVGGPARLELTSATTDGRDRKVIVDLLDSQEWLPNGRFLGVQQARAYCLLTRRSRPGAVAIPTLCSVSETKITPVATLRGEPGPLWFDEGYLYYTLRENREDWLDWSSAGLTRKSVRVLYRIRLPD